MRSIDTSTASRSGPSAVAWEDRTPVSNFVQHTMNGIVTKNPSSGETNYWVTPEVYARYRQFAESRASTDANMRARRWITRPR